VIKLLFNFTISCGRNDGQESLLSIKQTYL